MTVESPCIRHCTLDQHDMCVGCGRMLDEITAWTRSSDDKKRRVKAAAANRLARPAMGR